MSDVAVTMSAFDWHVLLEEMEYTNRIVNRDTREVKRLYELIASQLAGQPVILQNQKP